MVKKDNFLGSYKNKLIESTELLISLLNKLGLFIPKYFRVNNLKFFVILIANHIESFNWRVLAIKNLVLWIFYKFKAVNLNSGLSFSWLLWKKVKLEECNLSEFIMCGLVSVLFIFWFTIVFEHLYESVNCELFLILFVWVEIVWSYLLI